MGWESREEKQHEPASSTAPKGDAFCRPRPQHGASLEPRPPNGRAGSCQSRGRHISGRRSPPLPRQPPAGPPAQRVPQCAARGAERSFQPQPLIAGSARPPPSSPAGALPSGLSEGKAERSNRDPPPTPLPPRNGIATWAAGLPEILIHGFKEEFVAVHGPVAEDIFKIG